MTAPLLDLTAAPEPGAERATQLLHGEAFTVYETAPDGLAWGQAALDGYVGYVSAGGLGPAAGAGQRVTALWSQVYARPAVRARGRARAAVPRRGPGRAAPPAASPGSAAAASCRGRTSRRSRATSWRRPSASSACPTSGAAAAPAASTARALVQLALIAAGRPRRATPTCRRRCSATALGPTAPLQPRRSRVLEGPRRDHARRRRRCSTPTPTTWRWPPSRSRRSSRGSRRRAAARSSRAAAAPETALLDQRGAPARASGRGRPPRRGRRGRARGRRGRSAPPSAPPPRARPRRRAPRSGRRRIRRRRRRGSRARGRAAAGGRGGRSSRAARRGRAGESGGRLARAAARARRRATAALRPAAPQPEAADHLALERRQLGEPADRGAARDASVRAHFVRISLPCRVMRRT